MDDQNMTLEIHLHSYAKETTEKNAIAVKDGTRTVAHLIRRDAVKLSLVLDGGLTCNDVATAK
jgi:hypothetical protein